MATECSLGEAELGDRPDDRFARREGVQRTGATATLELRALLASVSPPSRPLRASRRG